MRRKSSLIQHLKIHQEDNLYYFGHLRKYEAKQLMDAVIQNYSIDLSHQLQEKESKDLADQIIVNSSIAFRKYQLFTYAIFCLIGSISTVPLCVILSFLLK
jgi:hypothetical protein